MPYSKQINALIGGSSDAQKVLNQLNLVQNETDRRFAALKKEIEQLKADISELRAAMVTNTNE